MPVLKLGARTCRFCGKAKGVFAFVLSINGKATPIYAHPTCFQTGKKTELSSPQKK